MSVQLVYQPTVVVVADTAMLHSGLMEWARLDGLEDVIQSDETPLGRIAYAVAFGGATDADLITEMAGRACYRSWAKGRDGDAYIQNLLEQKHGSVLEHASVNFMISGISRSLSHELIRHHVGRAVSQESQRYVDASEIRFVVPPLLLAVNETAPVIEAFEADCGVALEAYKRWVTEYELWLDDSQQDGLPASMPRKRAREAARAVLPNAAETRMMWTMNLREARHVCAQRGAEDADLEIRRLAVHMTEAMKKAAPRVFADFEIYTADDGFDVVRCRYEKV